MCEFLQQDEIVIAESRPALNYAHHNGGVAHKKVNKEISKKSKKGTNFLNF